MYNFEKKTKIVATLGPTSEDKDTIRALIKNGANIVRLNFSHGDYTEKKAKIQIVRELEKELDIVIPVILDTKGPEIRTHKFKDDGVMIEKDSIVRISMEEKLGTSTSFSVTYPNLYDDIKINDMIKIDDGKLHLLVVDKDPINREIIVKPFNSHFVTNRKGLNIPSARLHLPALSEQDKKDILFGLKEGIDLIAASFIRSKEDILEIREYIKEIGCENVPIIAKIENFEGCQNIEEIIKVADGVMVARGDLGVEIEPERVPIIQGKLIALCQKEGKPVITATQMLDSMQVNPLPTRAEVSDVATAIREGSDAVMLSGETANGSYPVASVNMQTRIAKIMENELDYKELASKAYATSDKSLADALANSIANTTNLIDARLIVCFNKASDCALRIAKARPKTPLVFVTDNRKSAVKSMPSFAIYPIVVPSLPETVEEMEKVTLDAAKRVGLGKDEPIIITGGIPVDNKDINFMRVIYLREAK
ncbi:MAG: pyruvate kinase [Bacilli bacterium]|jgi:pyruvate kinase